MKKCLKQLPNITSLAALFCIMAVFLLASNVRAANEADYQTLLGRIKNGETVDYTQLRQAYVNSPDYDPYSFNVREPSAEMHKSARQDDCKTALNYAKRVLDMQFLAIDAHNIAGYCHEKLGRKDAATQERAIARGLIQSIVESGDGKTPETAFIVVTLEEQYALIMAMRLQRRSKSLIYHDGHSYDVHEVAQSSDGASGMSIKLYFRIDPILAHLDARLQDKEKPASPK